MKIHIKEYKNIRNLTIPVSPSNTVILLGSNGVGKTNTLEAIYRDYGQITDTDTDFKGKYLLSLDLPRERDKYYPNADVLGQLFTAPAGELPEVMLNFLEEEYTKTHRPMMKQYISDALQNLKYAEVNREFDLSPAAVIRLVILNVILAQARENNEKYIVMVDSPELYAHPMLMDELTATLNQLRALGSLIIISTHNDRIVSRMFSSFADIIKMTKKDGLLQIQTVDIEDIKNRILDFYRSDENLTHSFSRSTHHDDGLLKILNEDLEGYLITSLRDHIITIFSSPTIILGEGISEDVLFDYIDNELHPNWLSEYQVGFMSCIGKSTMPLYFITLNAIGVKTFVLFDYDNDTNPVHNAFRLAFKRYHLANKRMFRSYYLKPDLENYLNFFDDEDKIASIVKPVNIYNYTFLRRTENRQLNQLLEIMHDNIAMLNKERNS